MQFYTRWRLDTPVHVDFSRLMLEEMKLARDLAAKVQGVKLH